MTTTDRCPTCWVCGDVSGDHAGCQALMAEYPDMPEDLS